DAARHACGEIATSGAEDDDAAASHVLAAVVAYCEHDRVDAAVANAEALAGHAADVGLAAGRPVEGDVADDHVLAGHERAALGRVDDDLAAGEAFADVIVGVAFQSERDAARHKGAETLTGRALEMQLDRVVGQPGRAVAASHLAAQDRA